MSPDSAAVPVNTALQRIANKLGLQPNSIQDIYPCTTLQTALLVADLHGLGSYLATFVFDLSQTPFSPRDVKSACEAVYAHTPILRTYFLQSKGGFLQVVTNSSLRWVEHDNLETYLQLERDRDAQLGELLARFAWITDISGNLYMVWTLHHALYDEWSIDLLFRDLSSLASSPHYALTDHPRFSKFVKALSQVDQPASKLFWERHFARLAQCQPILPSAAPTFETSQQSKSTGTVEILPGTYQLSTLAIAAWSICVSKLSGSDTVAFGNIVNGRTLPMPGILDICGPTMTTVPYVVDMPWVETTCTFLDRLEQMRKEMLPYEQMGFLEYSRMTGTGRYDTLLSIQSSRTDTANPNQFQLRPSESQGRQMRHPCLIYLNVLHEASRCSLKASFDERFLNEDQMSHILSQLGTCMEALSSNLDVKLRTFSTTIDLSKMPQPVLEQEKSEPLKGEASHVDPKILTQVREALQATGLADSVSHVTPNTTLRELGLDSLSTVAFVRKLSENLTVTIPLREVTGLRRTISDIARTVRDLLHGTYEERADKLDLFSEAERYARDFVVNMAPSGSETRTENDTAISSILLTGASGYVGIAILQRLLSSTSDTIILLVRCTSAEQGLNRIRQAGKMARWSNEELHLLEDRVRVWPSDLAAPSLGLGAQQLNHLQRVRAIIHNGARVDFTLDYRDLEATNVSATAFLLSSRLKSRQSPCFVYLTGGRGSPLDSKESLKSMASKLVAANGYAQTKFTSELLLDRTADLCRASGRAAQLTIVHPGIIIGGESTGVANIDDFIWRYVAASIQMGVYVPAVPTKREWINLMTVESVAAKAVSAIAKEDSTGICERRSMRSGLPVARFWEVIIETIDPERMLEPVSEWEWLERLQDDLSKRSTTHPLFSLSQMLLQGFLKGIGGVGPRPEDEPSQPEMIASERAVAANVRYLDTVGFFSAMEGHLDAAVFQRRRH